jgi:cytochrome c oxidase cbb3-type subunit 1
VKLPRSGAVELAAIHALLWLAIANAVGVLLALLLLSPSLGSVLAPLGYGRFMPVHLDLELYGWASLPLVAVLLRLYLPQRAPSRGAAWALGAWSGALLFGAVSWLAGDASGKPFLDWRGGARLLLSAAMTLLALVLAAAWARASPGGLGGAGDALAWARSLGRARSPARARTDAPAGVALGARAANLGKGVLLAGLVPVPFVLYWAASPRVHPPINPDTSGPTGASLLGSTLAVVALVGVAPLLAGVRLRPQARPWTLAAAVALFLQAAFFTALDHGDHSHREPLEQIAVWSLLIWVPLLDRHLRGFDWPVACARWLRAFLGWWGLLVASAATMFLPGLLERVKFTNVLVAHAHGALAGVVTCVDVLLLEAVLGGTALAGLFSHRRAFALWHGGNLAMIASLVAAGLLEGASPGFLFKPAAMATTLYVVRAAAGTAMLLASLRWLRAAFARTSLVGAAAPVSAPAVWERKETAVAR